MNFCRLFLGFLLWLIPFTLSAQRTVSGRVTDAETGDPVVGAAVFLSNTTVGTTTDANGNYQLKIPGEGSYRLTVSHVAYEPVFKDIEPGETSQTIDVAMQIHEMEEVTVTVKTNVRKKDVDLFWKTLFGKKPSKKTIYVTNPDEVYFYYNIETQKLTVSCRVPLQIVNNETGYQIQYVLNYFTHDYSANLSSWEGQYLFAELEPENLKQHNAWDKKRKEVYSVSISNFIRSLYHDSLLENGFLLMTTKWTPDLGNMFHLASFEDFMTSTDSGDKSKIIYVPSDLFLCCFGKPITSDKELKKIYSATQMTALGRYRSLVRTPSEPVQIFSDGTFKNPIYFSNSFSGLDKILPVEYHPDGKTGLSATEAILENEPEKLPPLADSLLRVARRFDRQLAFFPQEKVHLHTDKPYYLSGERIWFRAHVVDAATHVPSFSSSSVYVELFDARDSVVSRVRTGLANDLFSGYIFIPEDTPEGDYTIRAWTNRMRNLDEDYFFLKNIRIGNPMSRIMQVDSEFEFLPNQKIGATFRFSPISPASPASPASLKVSINNQNPVNLKSIDGKSGLTFNLSSVEKQRVMLLDAMYEKNPYQQFIKIPFPDDDFDVSFYPEGGSALFDCTGRMAIKVLQRDGTEIDIEGTVVDSHGNEMTQFKTEARGMGQFRMRYDSGETYYAICTNNKGQSKRFDLPAAKSDGYALSASWFRNQLIVKALQPESQKTGDTLCLIVHTRGVVQDARIWENTGEAIYYPKDFFPSGVIHLLLLTKEMVPLSERLVFANNDDQAKVACTTDKDTYSSRSPVAYTVSITDKAGEPLHGNFSVSVTDDHDVAVDTTANILSSLLLTSDLRGHIPEPAYFFRKNNQSAYMLDLLMLTQGWRRYDIERIVHNNPMLPDTLLEKGYDVTGMVRTVIGWNPVKNTKVSAFSFAGDFSEETVTDSKGRFFLPNGETPDSTWFIVQTELPRTDRLINYELILDNASYPDRQTPVVSVGAPDCNMFARYADKAEQRHVDEHGNRIYHLSEVVVTANRFHKYDRYGYFESDAQFSMTEEDLKKLTPMTMKSLLSRVPGLWFEDETPRYGMRHVDIVTIPPGELEGLEPSDIERIDFVPESRTGVPYKPDIEDRGLRERYVLFIHIKFIPKKTPYIKRFMPLGFQKPAEFYAPKYDMPAQNAKPDLRTTIHWQPSITTDENGKASFSFYTADAPSTYTVMIEGMTEDGKIVYRRDKIVVRD